MHVRRRRVGRCEDMHGEDSVRRVLSRHIFGSCSFSVFPGRWVYWNMNTVGIQKSISFIHLLYSFYSMLETIHPQNCMHACTVAKADVRGRSSDVKML